MIFCIFWKKQIFEKITQHAKSFLVPCFILRLCFLLHMIHLYWFCKYVMLIVDRIENWFLPNMLSTLNKVVIIIILFIHFFFCKIIETSITFTGTFLFVETILQNEDEGCRWLKMKSCSFWRHTKGTYCVGIKSWMMSYQG